MIKDIHSTALQPLRILGEFRVETVEVVRF
ncbi:Uncharacterised protein [Pasteurella testudinis]|nr:Uncharacterised protein [Pasteurella testudinis]